MGSKELLDILKQAEEAQKMNAEQSASDNIPREAPLQYEFMCRLVGSLYIEYQHTLETIQKQQDVAITELQNHIRDLMSDNKRLKEELGNVSRSSQPTPQ